MRRKLVRRLTPERAGALIDLSLIELIAADNASSRLLQPS